jgi:hypothetical protein
MGAPFRRRGLLSHELLDPVSDCFGILVLPRPDDCPAARFEPSSRVCIARRRGLNLVSPPLGIRLHDLAVSRTPMPEAAVNEHGDAGPAEDNVCSPWHGGLRSEVNAVPQSASMKLPTKSHLGLGIAPLDGLHAAPYARRAGRGGLWSGSHRGNLEVGYANSSRDLANQSWESPSGDTRWLVCVV